MKYENRNFLLKSIRFYYLLSIFILFFALTYPFKMKKIVIFASGSGSNAEKIILKFKNSTTISVIGIVTNNSSAKVLEKAKKYQIESFIFNKIDLESGIVLKKMQELKPDLIVLAGFLLKFPTSILEKFQNRVINIHPALLPKYGGKGMYGINVHQAVLDSNEMESGITIHYVNEHYDEGKYIVQKSVSIADCKTAQEIGDTVLKLEHECLADTIEKLLTLNL